MKTKNESSYNPVRTPVLVGMELWDLRKPLGILGFIDFQIGCIHIIEP